MMSVGELGHDGSRRLTTMTERAPTVAETGAGAGAACRHDGSRRPATTVTERAPTVAEMGAGAGAACPKSEDEEVEALLRVSRERALATMKLTEPTASRNEAGDESGEGRRTDTPVRGLALRQGYALRSRKSPSSELRCEDTVPREDDANESRGPSQGLPGNVNGYVSSSEAPQSGNESPGVEALGEFCSGSGIDRR